MPRNSTRPNTFLATAVILGAICGVSGCAARHYGDTQAGTRLSGSLRVEWRKPNRFLFVPDESDPLTFVRHDGSTIVPETMWTDGGSIPRPFWVLKNFSPWGYGPAFIVHDWLFHMHRCRLPGWEGFDVKIAAQVMSEVMKTLMETPGFDYGDKQTVYSMYLAVQTPAAASAWNGQCNPPSILANGILSPPDAVFEIRYP
jgi:hypothetical protein